MAPEIKGYIFAVLYVAFAIGLALLFHKFGLSKKYTRKIVHILVGLEWVILSHFMGPTYHFLIVCLVFTALLALSYFLKLLPAMSSDGENDPGTVYYGVSMSVMSFISLFVPEMLTPFGIGVFCTSFGDGLAGVAGQLVKRHNPKIFRNKSLVGTLVNFVVSFAVALVFSSLNMIELSVWHCLLIGIFSAGLELIGAFGLDNLFVTIGVSLLTFGIVNWEGMMHVIAPFLVTPFIIAVVIERRALTVYGLIAAIMLDIAVTVVFANLGFVVMVAFFFGALIVDKIKKKKKAEDTITKKEGTRDLVQVIANGLVPLVMAVMYVTTEHTAFLVAYVASFAEAFADTTASGFGVFSKTTLDVFRLKKCECGISGGMSVVGTLSSLVAAFLLSFIPFFFGAFDISLVVISALTAFAGVLFDSFLGSVFQIKFKCRECGSVTEREEHCGKPTLHVSGYAFFDNDVVNLLSGAFTAILAAVFFIIIK